MLHADRCGGAAHPHAQEEYVPVLQQIAAMFLSKDYPSDESELPRAMGTMDFDLRGTKGTRSAGTFDLWMAQVRTQPALSLSIRP